MDEPIIFCLQLVSVFFSMVSSFSRICSLKPSWLNDIDKKMHSGNVVSLVWFHLGFNFNVGNLMKSSTDLFCKFNTFPFQAVESIRYNKISGVFPFKRKTTPMNKLRLKKCKLSKKNKKKYHVEYVLATYPSVLDFWKIKLEKSS